MGNGGTPPLSPCQGSAAPRGSTQGSGQGEVVLCVVGTLGKIALRVMEDGARQAG